LVLVSINQLQWAYDSDSRVPLHKVYGVKAALSLQAHKVLEVPTYQKIDPRDSADRNM